MIIVKIIGGLGNQMFEYALYKTLFIKGKDVKLDTESYYDLTDEHNGYELEDIFNINPSKASKREVLELSDSSNHIVSKIRRKLFGIKKSKRRRPFRRTVQARRLC